MSRVVVIGGGIAGLSVTCALARRGRPVVLIERQSSFGAGSSGKSASIFRTAVPDRVNVERALQSRIIGERLVPGYIRETGALYICKDEAEQGVILDAAAETGVRPATTNDWPKWIADRSRPALWSPHDGIIDVDRLLAALVSEARRLGAELQLNQTEVPSADLIVDCTGAWSPIATPRRRHLFILECDSVEPESVIWDLGAGLYLRPHPEGVLACACDESEVPVRDDVPIDPTVIGMLREKLSIFAPALANAPVRRQWAGLRPLTSDHRFVIGPDPHEPRLFRVGGFGGHGLSAGLAAGEIAAAMICGESYRPLPTNSS